jgi:signal transduction histidine kinase
MSTSVDRRGGTIAVVCERRLPPLAVDRGTLMPVLLNLARNSAESFDEPGHRGAVSIFIEARRAADGGLVVDVRDSGPGFRPHLAESFFEPGTSTKGRGSGIGLVTCRRIVESLGGRITLRSNGPGTGAVAHVELPPEVFSDAGA